MGGFPPHRNRIEFVLAKTAEGAKVRSVEEEGGMNRGMMISLVFTREEPKEVKKEETKEEEFQLFKTPKSKSAGKKASEKEGTESATKRFGNSTVSNAARDWLNLPKRMRVALQLGLGAFPKPAVTEKKPRVLSKPLPSLEEVETQHKPGVLEE